jgi:hypothetical protein
VKRDGSSPKKRYESTQTCNGGFTKKQLALWGVPWLKGKGPPTGWKKWILKYGIPYEGIEDLYRELDKQCDDARDRDRT